MPAYELILVLADLFEAEMGLQPVLIESSTRPQPRVFIYNQKWKIPPIEGLFLEIGFLYAKPFGAGLGYQNDPASGELKQIQTSNTQEVYTVTAWSKNADAVQRMHEIPMVLRSFACQKLCEKYSFKVGFIPTSFVDASETEATAILNKYVCTFSVLRSYERVSTVPYYDQFTNPPKTLLVNQ